MDDAGWALDRLREAYGDRWEISVRGCEIIAVPKAGGETITARSPQVLRCHLADAVVALAYAAVRHG